MTPKQPVEIGYVAETDGHRDFGDGAGTIARLRQPARRQFEAVSVDHGAEALAFLRQQIVDIAFRDSQGSCCRGGGKLLGAEMGLNLLAESRQARLPNGGLPGGMRRFPGGSQGQRHEIENMVARQIGQFRICQHVGVQGPQIRHE